MAPHVMPVRFEDLPVQGDVLVRVLYSSLNYKDALAVTDRGKIIRGAFPFVPGIDLVGRVVESTHADHAPGDLVVATGWGLGENHWGGYCGLQWLQSDWLVALPERITPHTSMVIGTAGLTAMLAVMALEDAGLDPTSGEVVVTGATGGVGTFAVYLLSRHGFRVVASTGKSDAKDYLEALGAARTIDRDILGSGARRPLDSGAWAGAIDTVGGATLEAILSQLLRHGAVAACGLASGAELHTTVYPFILRGASLLGVDSNTCPVTRRRLAWSHLADAIDESFARRVAETITLDGIPDASASLLEGKVMGRIVVSVAEENQ